MAAEKARGISSFQNCSNYASQGISILPSDKWDSHSEMAFKFYSLATEAERVLGHYSQMEIYCSEVLAQKSILILQKKDTYLAKLDRMANAEL
eukprot:13524467-Ditylum_brightwellii.AAC.1